jgi:hypothetical protein
MRTLYYVANSFVAMVSDLAWFLSVASSKASSFLGKASQGLDEKSHDFVVLSNYLHAKAKGKKCST